MSTTCSCGGVANSAQTCTASKGTASLSCDRSRDHNNSTTDLAHDIADNINTVQCTLCTLCWSLPTTHTSAKISSYLWWWPGVSPGRKGIGCGKISGRTNLLHELLKAAVADKAPMNGLLHEIKTGGNQLAIRLMHRRGMVMERRERGECGNTE